MNHPQISKYLDANGKYSPIKSEQVRKVYKEQASQRANTPHITLAKRENIDNLFKNIFT